MTGNEYQKLAMRTANEDCFNLANAGLGVTGEAGEVGDIIKKHLFHKHALNKEHLAKELGDVMWYVALTASLIGYDLETVMQMNVDKLRKRYPDGFSSDLSQHRKEGDI
jgi:NTP pyrophosphatase (non-canonical NTP hydrolase)